MTSVNIDETVTTVVIEQITTVLINEVFTSVTFANDNTQVQIVEDVINITQPAPDIIQIVEDVISIIEVGTRGPVGGTGETRATITETTSPIADDSGTVYDNEGALSQVTVNLPASEQEFKFAFLNVTTFGWNLVAPGGETINIGGSESSVGGTQSCTKKGSSVTLDGTNSSGYFSRNSQGVWIET
ncbi:MAG: hypothetical protein ACUZ8E_17865 [Candidatus Anammoxibacter sp.]